MAAIQILVHGMTLLHVFVPPADWHNALLTWSVRLVMTVYIVIALRRNRRPVSRLRGENVYIYRPVLFLTFALT